MRGFRGNRAIQNQFSSRYGNQGTGVNYQRPAENFRQADGTAQPRPDLPDWLKTPETIAAEKAAAKAAPAPAAAPVAAKPQPPKFRVIEGGAAKAPAPAAKKAAAKAPASAGRKTAASSFSEGIVPRGGLLTPSIAFGDRLLPALRESGVSWT